jgi:hypothetical protein
MPKTNVSRQLVAEHKGDTSFAQYSPKWKARHDLSLYGDNNLGLWGGEPNPQPSLDEARKRAFRTAGKTP